MATNNRGPGMMPRLIAVFTSTSAYMAPSVSRSRRVVKPFSSAVFAATVARMVRYGIDSLSNWIVVIRGRNVALQEDVGMVVDQAWQDGGRAQVDHPGAGRARDLAPTCVMRSFSTTMVWPVRTRPLRVLTRRPALMTVVWAAAVRAKAQA